MVGKNFDIYLRGEVIRAVEYDVDALSMLFRPTDQNGFFGEINMGFSYEFLPNKEAFLEFGPVFNGKKYMGNVYRGGLRMKF